MPARNPTVTDALLLASLGALLAGVGHGLFVLLRVYGMNRFSWASRDILWFGPISYALYIVPLTLLAFAVARRLSSRARAMAMITTPLTIGAVGVLLLARVVHPLALLLLSFGIAWRIASWLSDEFDRRVPIARRFTAALAIGVALISVLVRGVPLVRESRAIANGTAASEAAPNVLFIILDTVRAASMGMYGYKVPNTPHLEQLAATGTRFAWAFSPASWTLPSHASMFTGLDARATESGWRQTLDGSKLTIGEYMASRGIVSAGFVANKNFTTWETGIHQGFHRWDDFDISPKEIFLASTYSQTPLVRDLLGMDSVVARWTTLTRFNLRLSSEFMHVRRSATNIVDDFLGWQSKVGDKRYFAFVNLFDGHDPYIAPKPWDTKWVAKPKGKDRYESSIAYMDHELGRLFDELRRREQLDKTLIIVSSDHGELFGEHDLFLHGHFLYLNSIHVPLVMRLPGRIPAGTVVTVPVSLDRIAATILDMIGDTTPAFPGTSLRATWGGATKHEEVSTAESWVEQYPWPTKDDPASKGPVVSVADSTWHWLRNGDGREELYRYREDAVEENDVAPHPENADTITRLRERAARRKLIEPQPVAAPVASRARGRP